MTCNKVTLYNINAALPDHINCLLRKDPDKRAKNAADKQT